MKTTSLARRTFLKGLGLSLGLPLLECMTPLRAAEAKKPSPPPVRLAFVFFPNGANLQQWTPSAEGEQFSLSPTLAPLAEVRDHLTVLTGLGQDNGRAKGDGAGDHARSAASYLTGAHPYKTSGADIRVGISVDQAAASRIGHLTKLPSLELGLEAGQNSGNCDSGYSCAYSSNISWKTATTPMAKEIRPRLVFERLFGDGQQAQESKAQRDFYRQSILDLVAQDARRLQAKVGPTDRRKLDEYFTSVRELEQRLTRTEQDAQSRRPDLVVPASIPPDLSQYVRLMYDLLVLAFRTDTTRVATLMLANDGSNRSYRMLGFNEGHHELSHHGNKPEMMEKIHQIDRFLIGEFAYFLKQLKAVEEGPGTLLDHALLMYGGGLGDGNRHDHVNLPIVLAGRGGAIRSGRHLRMPQETPLNNLFLTLLARVGAEVPQLGDSTGRLSALEA